jgi:hypothetical protein
VVLTAPLYSNPSLLEVVADHSVQADAELTDRLLPPAASFARAILVGHSHYDHLMDVPYVALHKARAANVYGSETTASLLASIAPDLARQGTSVIAFSEDEIWDHGKVGRWRDVAPGVRIAAIRSEHSPQAALEVGKQRIPIHLWRGKSEGSTASALPRSASDWIEGSVLAFLVDFMDGDRTRFRIYYQDSGTNSPIGLIPEALKGGRDADLAIICLGGDYERLIDHPEAVIRNTRPKYILLAHWEDFFVTQDAYCTKGGHYGPLGGSGPGCAGGEGRVYALPDVAWVEGNKVKPFLKRVRRAIRELEPRPRYWLPCPTRSIFEFPLG